VVTIPNAGTFGAVTFCSNAVTGADLFDWMGGNPDAGGTWSPALSSGTGVFDPTVDTAGTYTYAVSATGCPDVTADVDVALYYVDTSITQISSTQFMANASGMGISLQWMDCTPGTVFSGATSPTFTAYANGDYAVIVSDNGCVDTSTCVSVTSIEPPVADFTASSTNITEGTSITFTDNSTNSPWQRSWQFSGGTPSTSTDQNPIVYYSTAGTFDVALTATNSEGSDTETKIGYITVTSTTGIEETPTKPKELLTITDLLGRTTYPVPNTLLFYIYDDGSVEKKIQLER
jgi:hypothetical protein